MSRTTISKRAFRRFRIKLRHIMRHYVAVLSQIQIGNLTGLHYHTLVQIHGFRHITYVILEIIVHLESVVWQMTIFIRFVLRAKAAHLFFDIHL